MPANICVPMFRGGDDDVTYRASAAVVGKTFGKTSGDIQSGPTITTAVLPTTWDGGNLQIATCPAAERADGVFAYDVASGVVVPVIGGGNVVPVTAGAAITAGVEVEVGAAGKAITLAAGIAVGRAKTTAANNTDCFIDLY